MRAVPVCTLATYLPTYLPTCLPVPSQHTSHDSLLGWAHTGTCTYLVKQSRFGRRAEVGVHWDGDVKVANHFQLHGARTAQNQIGRLAEKVERLTVNAQDGICLLYTSPSPRDRG